MRFALGKLVLPEIQELIRREVDRVNSNYAQVEQVKKFTLLPDDWTPDSVELTPTMKLKRRGINEKYAAQIDAMYEH